MLKLVSAISEFRSPKTLSSIYVAAGDEEIVDLMLSAGMRGSGAGAISIVPTFVPTQETDGHICAQPATC